MLSRSLLLVLLSLTCFQSFTMAQNAIGPDQCCFIYQKHKIPVHRITAYEVIESHCEKPGVIFTLKTGRQVCADHSVEWVQRHMKTIDQRSTRPQTTH
ncbi:hypothetical protein AMELA_G00057750 [Ameiurus melas]|uniref:C-C motif chemokine n=1 Tax=Ameiurus melas TaxID=219545 RepID=A0A7J6B117_AMEME|nr:hypothetical protein AMELA_G00057750 [Ameiurus melas]